MSDTEDGEGKSWTSYQKGTIDNLIINSCSAWTRGMRPIGDHRSADWNACLVLGASRGIIQIHGCMAWYDQGVLIAT